MPFFFIAPVWLLCVVAGAIFMLAGRRRIGCYLTLVSTGAIGISFALSTAVLLLFPRLPFRLPPHWSGISFIAAYLAAIALGGIAGAAATFWLTSRILRINRRR